MPFVKLIRDLNDQFRRNPFSHGRLRVTSGVNAKGSKFVSKALLAAKRFDAFTPENDPWHEHDCFSYHVNGEKLIFRIDCYDRKLEDLSPDPADPSVTVRVGTIMLAITTDLDEAACGADAPRSEEHVAQNVPAGRPDRGSRSRRAPRCRTPAGR